MGKKDNRLILEATQSNRKDEFVYTAKLARGIGENHVRVTILFVNGVFDSVSYPFNGKYGREQWQILGAINTEIERLEKELDPNAPQCTN